MLRVLGKSTSINVRKVLWTCAVAGIDVTPEPWGSGETQSCSQPEFLTLNPNAMVPVLVDDGMPLWESNTAWRYAFMGLVRRSPAYTDAASIDTSAQAWNRHMAILDRQLAITNAHVAGERFTLADIVLGLSTKRWLSTPIERPVLPAIAAWYERLAQQPGFAEHCANGVP